MKKILSCRFEEKKVKRTRDKFAPEKFITVYFAARISRRKTE